MRKFWYLLLLAPLLWGLGIQTAGAALPDTALDRLKGAIIGTSTTSQDGTPVLRALLVDSTATAIWPAAAALADATANPTLSAIQTFQMGFGGTTWDRIRTGAFTASTTPTGVLDGLGLAVYNTTLPTFTNGQYGHVQMGSRGAYYVNLLNVDSTAALFPASAALSDALANPTTTLVGAVGLGQYNTTQPTVTTGNIARASLSSRAAWLVATGADTFNVTVNTALPAGTAVLGSIVGTAASTTSRNIAVDTFVAADGLLGTYMLLGAGTYNLGFNGTNWDRLRTVNTGQLVNTWKDAAGSEIEKWSSTAALADAVGNTTATGGFRPLVQNLPLGFNGTTWDRIRSGAQTNVAAATGFQAILPIAQYVATPPSITANQYNQLLSDLKGSLRVTLMDLGATTQLFPTTAAAADAYSNPTITHIGADVLNFNGTSWDRQRNNVDISVLTSASRTTTQTQADQTNYNWRGISCVLDMTTVGTGSVTLEIDGKDAVSGKYVALLTGAAVTTNSTNTYTVYPGNTVTANASASTVLWRTWRTVVTANNANAATYSVGCTGIV